MKWGRRVDPWSGRSGAKCGGRRMDPPRRQRDPRVGHERSRRLRGARYGRARDWRGLAQLGVARPPAPRDLATRGRFLHNVRCPATGLASRRAWRLVYRARVANQRRRPTVAPGRDRLRTQSCSPTSSRPRGQVPSSSNRQSRTRPSRATRKSTLTEPPSYKREFP